MILWDVSNHVHYDAVSHPRRILKNTVARTLSHRLQLNNKSTWLLLVFVWIHHVPDSVSHAWSPQSRSTNLLSCHMAASQRGCCRLHLQFAMDPSHIMQNWSSSSHSGDLLVSVANRYLVQTVIVNVKRERERDKKKLWMAGVRMAAVQLHHFQSGNWESLSAWCLLQSVLQYVDTLLDYMCHWRVAYGDAAATG